MGTARYELSLSAEARLRLENKPGYHSVTDFSGACISHGTATSDSQRLSVAQFLRSVKRQLRVHQSGGSYIEWIVTENKRARRPAAGEPHSVTDGEDTQ